MSRFALKFPYLIIVICLMTAVIGGSMLVRMPVDLFPPINIPVVVVATFYNGMPPEQIENDITSRQERFFTIASGIDHMESRSLPGVSLIKIYFQSGMNADTAVSNIANLAAAEMRRLPPGTLPPIVLKFDASSLPVCLVTLKGEGLTETQLRDTGQNVVRNQMAGVPGASLPSPFGGKYRQIMIYVDPLKLEARQLSVMDVVRKVNESNLIMPSGDVRIGPLDYNVYANSEIESMADINRIPLKTVGQSSVLVGDIGVAKDAAQIQTNLVRVDGQRSAYLPVLKQGGDVNTIAVVDGVKDKLTHLLDVPKQLVAKVVFDQSVFVKTAIENLIHEGVLGLVLTGVMILLFLGSLKATFGVFLSIPLSALATFMILAIGGGTVNSMMLGGLALAFSRLIDNSVVSLENVFRHMEMGATPQEAAAKGGSEVSLPVLAATLTTIVVFFPVTFLYGVSRYLFTALAVAVIISMLASYFVAMTVVPLFCAKFLKHDDASHETGEPHADDVGPMIRFRRWFNHRFNALLDSYGRTLARALASPKRTCFVILGIFAASLALFPFVGRAYFPRTDPGQFVINVKAPSGSHIEVTDKLIAKVEEIIRQEVAPRDLELIVSNIGLTPDFSAMYTSNSGQHTAFVQANLKEGHRTGSYEYMERVRKRITAELPQVGTYFQTGGLVDAVLNLGLPAPIDIQISGKDLRAAHRIASDIARKCRATPGVSDVLVPQDVDYPALRLEIDREHAATLGLSQKEIMENVITALTSNGMIAPSFWADPKTGNDYLLTVQFPENKIKDLNDLLAIPIRSANRMTATRLDSVCHIMREDSPTEIDHYQIRKVVDVYVAPAKENLANVYATVKQIVADAKVPENVTVSLRGSVQGMEASFKSFGLGLILSVVLVYLILVAQFKSFMDPLLILLAVPPGMTGVILTLWLTGTTLNIMSLMGIVLMVGIVASDSILIVEFVRKLRADGMSVREAIPAACRVRLRPILMTTLATLIGLIPMALALGAGSEAYAPLARVIIGGLAFSAFCTLYLVPAAYLIIYRKDDDKAAPAPRPHTPFAASAAAIFALLVCAADGHASEKRPAETARLAVPTGGTETPGPIDCLDLKTAEQIALRRAPAIASAYLQALASNQVTRQVRSALFPQLSGDIALIGAGDNISRTFTGSPLSNKTTVIGASGGLNSQTVLSRESNGVLFSQLITDFGRTSQLVSAARLEALSQGQRAELIRAQVLLLVDQAYFQALEAQALLRVAKSTVASRQLIVDRTSALVKARLKSELDASLARVSLEESKLLLLEADNKLNAAFAELSAALGWREAHRFTLVEEHLSPRRIAPLATLITEALEHRPETIGLRYRRDAAQKLATSERAARLPKISLQGAFGRTAAGDAAARETYAAAGFNVEVPLFTGGRLSARAEEASLRAQAEQKALEDLEDRVARDVNLAWLNVNTSRERITVTQALLVSASEAWELAKARYETGVASIVELSQAELGRTQAEIGNATATYEFLINRIALDYQVGISRNAGPEQLPQRSGTPAREASQGGYQNTRKPTSVVQPR